MEITPNLSMKTERITDIASAEAIMPPRAVARATKTLTARLPLDLHEHLRLVSEAGAGDVTKALIAILKLHRDGGSGGQDLKAISRGMRAMADLVAEQTQRIQDLSDQLTLARAEQGRAASEASRTISDLIELFREGGTDVDQELSARTPQAAPSQIAWGTDDDPLPAPSRRTA